jgi:clan AA aspartic protease
MMHGTVIGLQARMSVIIYAPKRGEVEIECVIDTGFEGFLTLPATVIEQLQLPYVAPIDANLADNSRIVTNVHQGIILWHQTERTIPVLAMGRRPLIGTALLDRYHLSIDFCPSGTVLIDDIM